MRFACGLHALNVELHHVIHLNGFIGEERFAVPGPDQRTVVSALNGDERVQILPGGKNLARSLCSVELATVTLDRRELPVELTRDVHDERRFERVLTIRQSVQQLMRAVRGTPALVARQPRQVTGVAPKLRRNTMVGMAANREWKYHNAGREVTYLSHDKVPRLIRVLKVGV